MNKNELRKKLVKKYAAKYARLKAIADNEKLDETERLIARLKLAEIPATAIHPRAQPLRHHRPPARLLSQVRPQPDRAAGHRQQGPDPGPDQVELVRIRTWH